MSTDDARHAEQWAERLSLLALQALPAGEAAEVGQHAATCAACARELAGLLATVRAFDGWPTDVLRPAATLWERLAQRVAAESGTPPLPAAKHARAVEADWQQPGPGIECRQLSMDEATRRVTMLVRLAPGAAYPPHRHAGVEELFLLHGELWIEDHKLVPGDYNRAEPGTCDHRVWSETGCTCVLITSTADELG